MTTTERGQPAFGRYLKETRTKLRLSLRNVEAKTEGRVRNAFLSQIENGKVGLPNIDLLADLSHVYYLDFWNLLWRAGYQIPKEYPGLTSPEQKGWTPLVINKLEDLHLTEEELDEVLDYADFVKERGRRHGSAPT